MVNSNATQRRLAPGVSQPSSDHEMHTRAPNGLGGHDGAIWRARYLLGGALPVGIIVQRATAGRKRPKTGLTSRNPPSALPRRPASPARSRAVAPSRAASRRAPA